MHFTPPPPPQKKPSLFIAHDVVFKDNISYSETWSILYDNVHAEHIEEATVVGNVCLGGPRWFATAFALPRLVTTAFFDKTNRGHTRNSYFLLFFYLH